MSPSAVKQSIAAAKDVTRRVQVRIDLAREQVLRADALVRRVRVLLERHDPPDDDIDLNHGGGDDAGQARR